MEHFAVAYTLMSHTSRRCMAVRPIGDLLSWVQWDEVNAQKKKVKEIEDALKKHDGVYREWWDRVDTRMEKVEEIEERLKKHDGVYNEWLELNQSVQGKETMPFVHRGWMVIRDQPQLAGHKRQKKKRVMWGSNNVQVLESVTEETEETDEEFSDRLSLYHDSF